MKKLFGYLFIGFLFTGCAGSSTTSEETRKISFKLLNEKPLDEELIGAWKADESAYALLDDEGYLTNIVRLYIEDASMVSYENLPDMLFNKMGLPDTYSLVTGYARWHLHQKNKQWQVTIKPDNTEEIDVLLFSDNGQLVLFIPVGDSKSTRGIFMRRTSPSGLTYDE